jgi:hypothetical protein
MCHYLNLWARKTDCAESTPRAFLITRDTFDTRPSQFVPPGGPHASETTLSQKLRDILSSVASLLYVGLIRRLENIRTIGYHQFVHTRPHLAQSQ